MLQMLALAAVRAGSTAAAPVAVQHQAVPPHLGRSQRADSVARTASSDTALEGLPLADLRPTGGDSWCQGNEAPVLFARMENLLPGLSRSMEEARQALSGTGAALECAKALAQCNTVHELCQVACSSCAAAQQRLKGSTSTFFCILQDAAVLAKSMEALRSVAHIVAAECAAWGKEADKLAARVEDEERAEAAAGAADQCRIDAMQATLDAARARATGATVLGSVHCD